mgnify:CR=1 FL=1
MATWANNSKNSSTFSNQVRGFADVTWDEAAFSWDDAGGSWDDPRDSWHNATKNSSSMSNLTKN